MNEIKWISVLTLISIFTLAGCSPVTKKATKYPSLENADSMVMSEAYNAADSLATQSHVFVNDKQPIVVASFTSIDNLGASTTFGRMISQQIASRFTQKAYEVVELLLRKDIYIRQEAGEFLLSRSVKNITSQHNAQAVVVGTYAIAKDNVYVTAKIVRTEDNVVLGATDFTIPMTNDVKYLTGARRR